jgi:hypothetical protein
VRPVSVGNTKALGELTRSVDDWISDRDDLAARVTKVAGNMRKAGPVAGAENSDADRQGTPLRWAGASDFTEPNVTVDSNTRHT